MRFAICSHLTAVRVGVALACSACLVVFGIAFTGGDARADGDPPATINLNFDDVLESETAVGAAYAGVDLGNAVVLAQPELAASPNRVLASGCRELGECIRDLEMRFAVPQQSVQAMVGLLVLREPDPDPEDVPGPVIDVAPGIEVEGETDSLETPETPEVTETPETPEVTETPETPETPEVTETPEETEPSESIIATVDLVAFDDAGNELGSAGTGNLRADESTPAVHPVAVQDDGGRIATVEVRLDPPALPGAVIILDDLSARAQTPNPTSTQTPGQGGDEPGPGGDEAGATETASAPSLLPLQIAVVVAALLAVAALLLTRRRAPSRAPNVHWDVVQSTWTQTVGNHHGPVVTLHARMRPEHDVTRIVRKEEP